MSKEKDGFITRHGNFKTLISYQKSLIIFDGTKIFTKRFLKFSDRTIDQMVQAARSCKQNIIEGSKAASLSSETEIKLTNVARASLDELLEDYHDFLRNNNHHIWDKKSKEAQYVRNLSAEKIRPPKLPELKHGSYERKLPPFLQKGSRYASYDDNSNLKEIYPVFIYFFNNRPARTVANIQICLINQCNYLLDKQIRKQEEDFLKNGGTREHMTKARIRRRSSEAA